MRRKHKLTHIIIGGKLYHLVGPKTQTLVGFLVLLFSKACQQRFVARYVRGAISNLEAETIAILDADSEETSSEVSVLLEGRQLATSIL